MEKRTDKELLEKLSSQLKEINETLSLGDMGLLKSETLSEVKNRIEDEIKSHKESFDKINALKIERAIPNNLRNQPKFGIFLSADQVRKELSSLHTLLQELIIVKGGSEQVQSVTFPELKTTGSTINRAINDAKTLINSQGAVSAVDRVHTVLHGFLKQRCDNANIIYTENETLNELWKKLREKHPAFSNKNENIDDILKSIANILDKLNHLRNGSSLAHSNQTLLDQDEAVLTINIVNTILSYLDSKFSKNI